MNIQRIITLLSVLLIFTIPAYAETTDYTYNDLAKFNDPEVIQLINMKMVNQNPDPAIAGDVFEFRVSVENIGGLSDGNYILEVNPKYPFEAVPGESLKSQIGVIADYQDGKDAIISKFKLKVAKGVYAGDYPVEIMLYKVGEKDTGLKKEIYINVANKEATEVKISKKEFNAGETTKMVFTIKNVGSANLKDVTFSWNTADNVLLPVGSGNSRYIQELDVGQSTDIEYDVSSSTDADPGLYQLNINMTFNDYKNGSKQSILTTAGVIITGNTDFEVVYSENQDNSYSFSVSNTGKIQANSVSVSVPRQDGWTISGPDTVIIGNLLQGDYTYASFSLSPEGNNQNITLNVKYTDDKGVRQTLKKVVNLPNNTDPTSEFSGLKGATDKSDGLDYSFVPYVIVGLLLVGGVAYYIIRRRKNSKKKLDI
ncbi:LPXTG-motif cell wall-anchored protein [Methanococcus voltae]|uniref:LPXTG-motif cell wall-anchored protein n=1 Tax=Methanococcus voltae TaxID=2188 RepID=A0A8J7USM2_METVO|nr:COG1361 S-layer family protein [Methanococcus voltae]MBP2200799.1 LPXTG-motif cell wall-anchored protein [Methanococcus voltae]